MYGCLAYHHDSAGSEAVGSEVGGVCNSVGRVVVPEEGVGALGSEGAGIEKVAENSWSHFQSARVSQAVVEIVEGLDEVGFGGGEDVEGNTAASVELEGAAVAAGIAEQAEVQVHEERKVGADRRLVVGSGNTVALGDAGELVVEVGVGKIAVDVGVAVAANRIDYHHNRSSRTKQTAQRVDAVVELAGRNSIVGCKPRN